MSDAEIDAAWERNLDAFEEAGYTRTNWTEWERNFWEAGYKQGVKEPTPATDPEPTETNGEQR